MPLYKVLLLFPSFYLRLPILSFLMMICAHADTTHFKKARNTRKCLSILFYCAFNDALSKKCLHIHRKKRGPSPLWCVRGSNKKSNNEDKSTYAAIKLTVFQCLHNLGNTCWSISKNRIC